MQQCTLRHAQPLLAVSYVDIILRTRPSSDCLNADIDWLHHSKVLCISNNKLCIKKGFAMKAMTCDHMHGAVSSGSQASDKSKLIGKRLRTIARSPLFADMPCSVIVAFTVGLLIDQAGVM